MTKNYQKFYFDFQKIVLWAKVSYLSHSEELIIQVNRVQLNGMRLANQ